MPGLRPLPRVVEGTVLVERPERLAGGVPPWKLPGFFRLR
jgi:hypothetical protein